MLIRKCLVIMISSPTVCHIYFGLMRPISETH